MITAHEASPAPGGPGSSPPAAQPGAGVVSVQPSPGMQAGHWLEGASRSRPAASLWGGGWLPLCPLPESWGMGGPYPQTTAVAATPSAPWN